MREIRPSGSEGGVVGNGHPYPYSSQQLLLGLEGALADLPDPLGHGGQEQRGADPSPEPTCE